MMNSRNLAPYLLAIVAFCANACACESAGKKRPTTQASVPTKDAMPTTHDAGIPEPDAQLEVAPVPASTQDPAILALAESIIALPPGLLLTVSELKAMLVLPANLEFKAQQNQWYSGYEKTTLLELGKDSALSLRLTMLDGTWEAPKGNSAPRHMEPIVESIELSGPGNLGLRAPAGARPIASQRPTDAAPMLAWPGGNYLSENLSEPAFYLGHFIGRAPFHYTESERHTLEQALIKISKAIAKGGLDVPAYMAKTYPKKLVSDTDQFGHSSEASKKRGLLGSPQPQARPLIYDFGAGRIYVGPSYISVAFVGPMKMPAFFAAHDAKMITTSFAHDAGQMTVAIEVPGLRIMPGSYYFGETRRYSRENEMGSASEANLLSLSISEKRAR